MIEVQRNLNFRFINKSVFFLFLVIAVSFASFSCDKEESVIEVIVIA